MTAAAARAGRVGPAIAGALGLLFLPAGSALSLDYPVTSIRFVIPFPASGFSDILATSGVGTSPHLAAELLSSLTGVKVVPVPYKGSSPALTAVVSGEVAVVFPNLPAALPLLGNSRLRALAVTSSQRFCELKSPNGPSYKKVSPQKTPRAS
jgi:tripartite-type tricarboxylate transporter receptor subunit TctC